jgi:hypothetical protein
MMQDPDVLLADEPVASLDPVNAEVVMEARERICRERGVPVLANLHSLTSPTATAPASPPWRAARWCSTARPASSLRMSWSESTARGAWAPQAADLVAAA